MEKAEGTFGLIFLGFFIVLVTLFVKGVTERVRRLKQMRAENYDWYCATHPDLCTSGRVQCFKCKSNRINARNMMNRTFMREHFCTQCGTTLYYSEEDNRRR